MTDIDFVLVSELQLCLGAGHSAALLDVRSSSVFLQGHIAGSVNLPFGELDRRAFASDVGQPWLVIADDDAIARVAVAVLRRLGFEAAGYLQGGISAWLDAGYPLERMAQV